MPETHLRQRGEPDNGLGSPMSRTQPRGKVPRLPLKWSIFLVTVKALSGLQVRALPGAVTDCQRFAQDMPRIAIQGLSSPYLVHCFTYIPSAVEAPRAQWQGARRERSLSPTRPTSNAGNASAPPQPSGPGLEPKIASGRAWDISETVH